MSRLISASIDVTKIDKSRLFKGKKGTYLGVDIWVNDEEDQYGNSVSINESLTAEERESGVKKNYIGNGKKVFGWGESGSSGGGQSQPSQSGSGFDNEEVPF